MRPQRRPESWWPARRAHGGRLARGAGREQRAAPSRGRCALPAGITLYFKATVIFMHIHTVTLDVSHLQQVCIWLSDPLPVHPPSVTLSGMHARKNRWGGVVRVSRALRVVLASATTCAGEFDVYAQQFACRPRSFMKSWTRSMPPDCGGLTFTPRVCVTTAARLPSASIVANAVADPPTAAIFPIAINIRAQARRLRRW